MAVPMPMMRIRKVRMRMSQHNVPMSMGMTRSGRYGRLVLMKVMLVVHVFVLVFQLGMKMLVLMPLGQMQP